MFSFEHFIGMVVMLAIILPIIFKKMYWALEKNQPWKQWIFMGVLWVYSLMGRKTFEMLLLGVLKHTIDALQSSFLCIEIDFDDVLWAGIFKDV